VPWQSTCSFCRDLDGDLRGLGRCGSTDHPVSAYDCNDLDPNAYYDPVDPHHAFPAWCGEHDLNCNGLADSVEQIGPDGFPDEHCTGCNQPCTGTVEHGSMGCVLVDGAPACLAQCSEGFADCDGELATGCEVPVSDPEHHEHLYYFDADGDGYGAGASVFFCSAPATGYASMSGDCNDGDLSIHPGVADDCDGIDNDCDDATDEDATGVGGSCTTGELGICGAGTMQCVQGLRKCVRSQQPTDEACNGLDDDCDGAVDDDIVGVGLPCTYAGELGPCAKGEMRCHASAAATECTQIFFATEDLPDEAGIDSNCDGIDGDASIAVFVDFHGSDLNSGEKDAPLQTVSVGIAKAQALHRSHVYIAVGEYREYANIVLPNGVSLFGGFYFDRQNKTWTRAESGVTLITRVVAATDNEENVSGVDAKDITTATTLQDLSFSIQTSTRPGGSSYGLRCDTCTALKVTRARFVVGNGAAGMTGAAGAGGADGVMGMRERTGGSSTCGAGGGYGGRIDCDAVSCAFYDGDSAPGSLGGAGGSHGSWSKGSAGGNGKPCLSVASGGNGGLLASAGEVDASVLPRLKSSYGEQGATGCSGGGGGGGGAGASQTSGGELSETGAGGSSGGCWGEGGYGGGSGGNSVGMVLRCSSGILLEQVALQTGNGGNGGVGGEGGRGGIGAEMLPSATGGGGWGGASGSGAGGGGGGGGAGGGAYGVVRDQATNFLGNEPQITHGNAGEGGRGGLGGAGGHGGVYVTAPGGTGNAGAQGAAGENWNYKTLEFEPISPCPAPPAAASPPRFRTDLAGWQAGTGEQRLLGDQLRSLAATR
jgi:hypothetical protein